MVTTMIQFINDDFLEEEMLTHNPKRYTIRTLRTRRVSMSL